MYKIWEAMFNMEKDLCIPLYLNDKTVFDLLAILEDGFSQIREVSTNLNSANCTNESLKVDFKANEILSSLLGITLGGNKNKEAQNNNSEAIKQERIHTNVSLFSKLRKQLIENNILKTDLTNINSFKEGDFVEIEGLVEKNPLIDTLTSFINMYKNLKPLFGSTSNNGNKKNSNKNKTEDDKLFEQLESFLNDLTQSNTMDLLLTKDDLKVVIPSQLSCFQNEFEHDLLDGKFKVLGKVIKLIDSDTNHISLFRKSSFKMLEDKDIEEFLNIINNPEDGINIPKMISKITGPAMIVLPIAIYI